MRSHWLNQDHVDEFKSNVTRQFKILKILGQLVNIAVALSRLRAGKFGGKIDGSGTKSFFFLVAILTVFIQNEK